MVAGLDDRHYARILDDKHILAAIICVVFTGIHDHGDRVALLDADVVDRQALHHFFVRAGGKIFLLEDFAVLHQVNRYAVREGRIGILVSQFRVLKIDIDLSVLSGDPLYIGGFALVAGDNEVFLDLYAVAGVILITVFHALYIDCEEGIVVVAELIVPAVISLLAKIVQCGSDIDALSVVPGLDVVLVLSDESACASDREFVFTAVVSSIVQTVDDHCEVIALAHMQGGDVQTLCYFAVNFRREGLLPEDCTVVVQGDSCAVRPCGIRVLILHLGVGGVDTDSAVLGDSPFDDRGSVVSAGIYIIALDLQITVMEVSVLARIIGIHIVCVVGIILVAPLEDPAVASLLAEVIFYIGKILACFNRVDTDRRFISRAVYIYDRDIKGAAVVGGVAFRVYHKVQIVIGLYSEFGNAMFDLILSFGRRVDMLFIEKLVVLIDLDLNAVREIGISVVLLELGVFDAKIDVAVYGGLPSKDRIVVDRRMDESRADGKVGRGAVDIFSLVLMGNRRAVIRICSVEISPSITSLLAEIFHAVRVVVRAGRIVRDRGFRRVYIVDRDIEASSVKCVVALGIHDKVQTLVVFHFKIFDLDLCQCLFFRTDRYIFKI